MSARTEAVELLCGVILAQAAALAGDESVRTEINDEITDEVDPPEALKVRLFLGARSTVIAIDGRDVAHVRTDDAVRRKLERQVRDALAGLQHGG
jgi:hypothetical protein